MRRPRLANYRAPIDIFIPEEQLEHLLYHAYHRANFLDEAEIWQGLRVWWAGVHHKGSLAVEIDSSAGTVIASDAFFYYENVENNHYLGVGESYDQAMETYEKARQRADHLIPMHDPKVLDRYPGGGSLPRGDGRLEGGLTTWRRSASRSSGSAPGPRSTTCRPSRLATTSNGSRPSTR